MRSNIPWNRMRQATAATCLTMMTAWSGGASEVRSAGSNVFGQLGDGTNADAATLVTAVGIDDVIAVAAGGGHTVALKSDGTVWAWGNRRYSQTGQVAGANPPFQTTPVQVSNISNAVAVAAGQYHSLALLADGTVKAWGSNGRGQLGSGTAGGTGGVATPVTVAGLNNVTAIAAGAQFSLALRSDGAVWAWGDNDGLQLGVPAPPFYRVAAQAVPGLADVTEIAAGSFHGLARRADGAVFSWGHNNAGQLGDGTAIGHAAPAAIPGLTGVISIAAGGAHSLALLNDGTLMAWGADAQGQLGDGGSQNQPSPVTIGNLGSILQIAAGLHHSLALRADGDLHAWGANDTGQLCDGTEADHSEPELVVIGGKIQMVDGGNQHTAAIIGPSLKCASDVTGDGATDIDDLFAVINAWGPCPDPRDCPADIAPIGAPDGGVDIDDLFAVINGWGECP